MSLSEIVVGIDFGTTHSGVSWAINGGNRKIHLITNWTNPSATYVNTTADKVPTIICYCNGSPSKWGYEAAVTDEPSFQWFKVLLEPNSKYRDKVQPVHTSNMLLGTLNKTAQDVAADYLRLLWQYTEEDIRKHTQTDWKEIYSVKVIITVPAMWSPPAREQTRKAALAAGITEQVTIVTEPEAAALAVFKDRAEMGVGIKEGDAFVVCDAGGGTVDLISYKVRKTSPLEIEECAVGDGDLCGSVFVDMAFEKYLKSIVGESTYNGIREKHRKRMLSDFDVQVKRNFSGEDKESSVELRGVGDHSEFGIFDDTIPLKAGMLRTCFDLVCDQIINLVEKQIDDVEERGSTVKAVLLVGGFGKSKYVHRRLEAAGMIKSKEIHVLQNDGAWSSICRGATMWGLEHSEVDPSIPTTVKSRIARYSYGLCEDVQFINGQHSLRDRTIDPATGIAIARNQMIWFIQRGESVEEDRLLQTTVTVSVEGIGIRRGLFGSGSQYYSERLWYCADESPPVRKDISVKELCVVYFSITNNRLWVEEPSYRGQSGKRYRDIQFDLYIVLNSATVELAVGYKNELLAYCETNFKESF